jgi:TPR repeat protein
MIIKKLILIFALLFSFNLFADFNEGTKAYENKDYKTAFLEFEESDKQGVAEAQLILGVMYHDGQGTSKNTSKAKYYTNKAYKNPNADTVTKSLAKKIWSEYKLWKY